MMKLTCFERCRNRLLVLTLVLLPLLATGTALGKPVDDIYQQAVPEMTTLECAKCHLQVFETLRDAGGLHKQACRDCHTKFHTFTPGTPWEERVPACSSCHEYPHGETLNACLECHKNAHAPIEALVSTEKLADLCDRCHQTEVAALGQAVGAHAGQSCVDCHQDERHGVSPQCTLCHQEPHAEFVDNDSCTACHPPHAPTMIGYDNSVANSLCAGCHADQQQFLQASEKKHKALNCVICHSQQHGNTFDCQHCHANGPHNPALLQNFDSCLDCHGDPHRLAL